MDDEELVLYLPQGTEELSVHGTWQITAHRHHRVYRGSLELAVGDDYDLTALLVEFLKTELPKRE
jgi:hypothetical protein